MALLVAFPLAGAPERKFTLSEKLGDKGALAWLGSGALAQPNFV